MIMNTFDRMLMVGGILKIVFRCRSLERDLERLKADHATEVNMKT